MSQAVRADAGRCAALVINELRTRGPMTRRQLEDATGYSRPTLSRTLAELIDSQRVDAIDDPTRPAGRGRPSRLIRLNPLLADSLGLEVARGHVAVTLADASGGIVAEADRSVRPSAGLTARVRSAIRLAGEVADQHDVDLDQLRQVVAGIPGPQPPGAGSGPQVRSIRTVQRLLAETFGAEVLLANNTKLTAMAEAAAYADTAVGNLIFLRIDEGIGGGFVIDGGLATGRGAAGEFGHVCVDPRGSACDCGGRGCLETVASLPILLAAAGVDDPKQLVTAGRPGKIINAAAEATGQVLAGAAATLNPTVIVLGGRVAALPGFAERVVATVHRLGPDWAVADLGVEVAVEDRRAGARGAVAVAAGLITPTPERTS